MTKNKDLFQAQAQIQKIETMSDHGVRIVVDTQEITDPAELTKLFSLKKGEIGYFLFKGAGITPDDIPTDKATLNEGDSKSPSERLRAVLFVYWKEFVNKGDFSQYYRAFIEKKINEIKENLPPRSEE